MLSLYHPRETIAMMMAPVATFLVRMTMVVIRLPVITPLRRRPGMEGLKL